MSVHVLELQPPADHQHLHPVQQLRDLLGEGLVALVLGGNPHFTGFFEHLLALRMDACVQRRHCARTFRAMRGAVLQLGEQGFEGFHEKPLFHATKPRHACGSRDDPQVQEIVKKGQLSSYNRVGDTPAHPT